MLVHYRVSPSIKFDGLSGERHCESEVSCPRTKHNIPGQGSNLECNRSGIEHTNHEATMPPTVCLLPAGISNYVTFI